MSVILDGWKEFSQSELLKVGGGQDCVDSMGVSFLRITLSSGLQQREMCQ